MDIRPRNAAQSEIADLLDRLVQSNGTAAHAYCAAALARTPDAFVRQPVDFADAVHHLSLLHGHAPGVIEHAANRVADNAARDWLLSAITALGRERTYLNQIVVAAGPLPSTAGQQQMTTIISQQRRALDMLAQSDRRGTALGAAAALVLDWRAIRGILDSGALRLGIEPHASPLPDRDQTLAMLTALEGDQVQSISRAVQFGAGQLLSQHSGVWDLLQARAQVAATPIIETRPKDARTCNMTPRCLIRFGLEAGRNCHALSGHGKLRRDR